MYSVGDYLYMIADASRVAAYEGALRYAIEPGAHVVEVGAGFGFFSILAVRAGASRVDAIEINPVVHLGPRVAEANGCGDRITFHVVDSSRLTLTQPADVLLADVRGPTPFAGRSLLTVLDARRRLLRPGGRIIAVRDAVLAAPCRTPAAFGREVTAAHGQRGVLLDPVERVVYDTPLRCPVEPGDLLAAGQPWAEIDYRTFETTDYGGTITWPLPDPVTADGLAIWFETDLGGGFGFTTKPGSPVFAYRQLFVPFRTPVTLTRGGELTASIGVHVAGDNYVWNWRISVREGDSPRRDVLDQNSIAELVIDPVALAAGAGRDL